MKEGRQTSAWPDCHRGGCFTCHHGDAYWFTRNVQAVAARHHDATGHPTWVEYVMSVRYGERYDSTYT